MITQFQVHQYLLLEVSNIVDAENYLRQPLHLPASGGISALTNFTRAMIVAGDKNRAQKCLAVAEKLFLNGDLVVRRLVEQIYVSGLASNLSSWSLQHEWEGILPYGLKQIFDKYKKSMRQKGMSEELADSDYDSETEH